jgi:hypothetical protein
LPLLSRSGNSQNIEELVEETSSTPGRFDIDIESRSTC